MTDVKKFFPLLSVIFSIILIQVVVAIAGGFIVLGIKAQTGILPGVVAGDADIGGKSEQEAVTAIKKYYDDFYNDKSMTIKYSENKTYTIKFSDVDAEVDANQIVKAAIDEKDSYSFDKILQAYFSKTKRQIGLVLKFNETKLKDKLHELAILIEKQPADASVVLKGENVVKIPEENGYKLDIENAISKIKKEAGKHAEGAIDFSPQNNFEIKIIKPKFTVKDFDGADEIVSRYITRIPSSEMEKWIKSAAVAINGVLIYPTDEGKKAGEFSFNKYLADANVPVMQNNEGYNQVASTLFAALLVSGIDSKSISRKAHPTPVDYIDLGLDAVVGSNGGDLKFTNTLPNKLLIFAEVRDGKVIVSLVGRKNSNGIVNSLMVEVDQKFQPSVIYVENNDLAPGKKKTISEGREGVKVSVYMIGQKDGKEQGKKLIHADEYKPVDSIVQVGPNTQFDKGTIK